MTRTRSWGDTPNAATTLFLSTACRSKNLAPLARERPVFNDIVLSFDPLFFAASAYGHFKSAADGCARLHAILMGDAGFIATLPP